MKCKIKHGLLAVACIALLSGCTDAQWQQVSVLGNAGEITCYSGGKIIYQGKSTGKISTEEGSDGWYFKEDGSGKLIRVSGACVIRN
jgi:hypothetical protein